MKLPMLLALNLAAMACQPSQDSTPSSSGCAQGGPCLDSSPAPLDPNSPWPKFRANLQQTGRSLIEPEMSQAKPWVFKTAKGIFSSPIISGDDKILFGSADKNFYALSEEGQLIWTVPTGEIIDSSGLIDDQGRVYFGSGDGMLRSVDSRNGQTLWSFAAEDPKTTGAFINWFEGSVAMGLNGQLYAPNDNFRLYAIDRLKGDKTWSFPLNDQSWSLPAVDPESGNLFFGSNYIAPFAAVGAFYKNIFAITPGGKQIWRQSVRASVTASPLLSRFGLVIVGSFDGRVKAYRKQDGNEVWSFVSGDHLYASPAELSDGSLIQASADGKVYALNGQTGALLWSFDAGEPIRSSPAVDGKDNIYFGGGDGALYVITGDGRLRYRMQLISEDRNDVNASPALGRRAVYVAAENGELWSVPYDYCLSAAGLADSRCSLEQSKRENIELSFVSSFGSYQNGSSQTIAPQQIIALTLTQNAVSPADDAVLDGSSLRIESQAYQELSIQISGDQKTVFVIPKTSWGETGQTMNLTVNAPYRTGLKRVGLKREGGKVTGSLIKTFSFKLSTGESEGHQGPLWALTRLAVPKPTIMPSYNQIGFDSLSYLVRAVTDNGQDGLALMIPADNLGQDSFQLKSDRAIPLAFKRRGGSLLLFNQGGFEAQALNFTIPFEEFRLEHAGDSGIRAFARTRCSSIPSYGFFLRTLGFCSPEDDRLSVFGAANWQTIDRVGSDRDRVRAANFQTGWFKDSLSIQVETDPNSQALYNIVISDSQRQTLLPAVIDPPTVQRLGTKDVIRVELPKGSLPKELSAVLLDGTDIIGQLRFTRDSRGTWQRL